MALLDRIGNSSAEVILSIALILIAGFLMTRITKKLRLPRLLGLTQDLDYWRWCIGEIKDKRKV